MRGKCFRFFPPNDDLIFPHISLFTDTQNRNRQINYTTISMSTLACQNSMTDRVQTSAEKVSTNEDIIRLITRHVDYTSLPSLSLVNHQFYEMSCGRLYRSLSVSWPLEHQANAGEYRMFKKLREEVKEDEDDVRLERSVSKIDDLVRHVEVHWHE